MKFLVIDDDANVCDVIAAHISIRTKDSVLVACSAAEARLLIREHRPEVLIVDFKMPEETGLDLIRSVRSPGYQPFIVLISAMFDNELALQSLRAGVCIAMAKPFGEEAIDVVLERATEQYSAAEQMEKEIETEVAVKILSLVKEHALSGLAKIVGNRPRKAQSHVVKNLGGLILIHGGKHG